MGPISAGVGNDTAVVQSQQSGIYFGPSDVLFPGDGSVHLRLSAPVDSGCPSGYCTLESGQINTAGLMAINPANIVFTPPPGAKVINGTIVIQIRARMPGPNAYGGLYWPAMWMGNAGDYGGYGTTNWPGGETYSEEVDLLEGLDGGTLGSNMQLHLHAASSYGPASVVQSSEQSTDMSLAYYNYTYYISATNITVYNNGQFVFTVPSSYVKPQWSYPQYLMIAFQADNTNAIYPTTASGTPNDMMISSVKIWQAG